ncbi:hypothetical protein D9M72_523970 [compost metagenome]
MRMTSLSSSAVAVNLRSTIEISASSDSSAPRPTVETVASEPSTPTFDKDRLPLAMAKAQSAGAPSRNSSCPLKMRRRSAPKAISRSLSSLISANSGTLDRSTISSLSAKRLTSRNHGTRPQASRIAHDQSR